MINRFAFIISIVGFGLSLYLLGGVINLPESSEGLDVTSLPLSAQSSSDLNDGSTFDIQVTQQAKPKILPSIDTGSLTVQTSDKAIYTLLLGRYTQLGMAEKKRKSLPVLDDKVAIIKLVDSQDVQWYWLTIGTFEIADAQRHIFHLKQFYELDTQIRVIPKQPKKSS